MSTIKRIVYKLLYWNKPEKFAIKRGVQLGKGNSFVGLCKFGSEPYLIKIGNKNRFSYQIHFVNHDGGRWVLDHLYPEDGPFLKFGKIEIGNNNFIGARSMILPNVTIGDNCVIAAGSIVTKNIPSGEVWGGVPAKRIMSIEEYKEKLVNNKNMYDLNALKTDKEKELKRVLL